MSGLRRPVARAMGGLSAGYLLAMMVTPAASNPPTPADKLAARSADVDRLEAELQALGKKLRACGRRESPLSAAAPELPRSHPTNGAAATQPYGPEPRALTNACSPPFVLSSDGLKTLEPECIDSSPYCEPPFRYINGIKVYKSGCP